MNIKIKFYGLGYNDINQAEVFIYDINENLLFKGITYNNEINIYLEKCEVYKLVARTKTNKISKIIYVGNSKEFYFSFYKFRTITFLLRDYYYNLPIERGELLLWQK